MSRWLFYSLLAVVLWGVWGTVTDAAGRPTGTSQGVSSYVLQVVSTLGLLPVAALLLLSKNLKQGKNFRRGTAAAFFTGVSASTGNWAFFQSLNLGAEGSTVYPLTGVYPIVTVILAWLFLRERLNGVQLFGFAVALASLIVFGFVSAGGPAPSATGVQSWWQKALTPWMRYALVTMVLFGVAGFLQKISTNNISNELSTVGFALGFLPIGVYILLTQKGLDWPHTWDKWTLCLAAGVIIGVGGLVLFAAYRWGKASVVTAVTALNPAVTVILAVPVFQDSFSLLKVIAIILALAAGVALTYEKQPQPAAAPA